MSKKIKVELSNIDLVKVDYWNNNWDMTELAKSIDITPGILKNPQNRRIHELFKSHLSDSPKGAKLLEVGCANSYWLAYFAKEYGFSVTGLDYSEKGSEQARQILNRDSIEGSIVCADMFCPPQNMLGTFDIVVSFGVAEHFIPTSRAIRAFHAFLKPGGMIVTLIPNMNGAVGFMQQKVNRSIYDLHVPLTKHGLLSAHEENGFESLFCDYVSFANFYVNNPGDNNRGVWINLLKFLRLVSKGVWLFENIITQLPSNMYCSPYVVCIAKKVV